MIRRSVLVVISAALAAPCGAARSGEASEVSAPETPAPIEVENGPRGRIEVSVLGPDEAVRELTAGHLSVRVGGRPLADFRVEGPSALGARASFMILFDGAATTAAGRGRALETARGLVPLLVEGGGPVMLVSNGVRLETHAPMTSEVADLLSALDRLRGAPQAQDENGAGNARHLRTALTRLGGTASPKALIHFGGTYGARPADARGLEAAANEAAAHAVRIYAVRTEDDRPATDDDPLGDLALETGGRALPDGMPVHRMAELILEDLSHVHAILFDPSGFDRDTPLDVRIRAQRPGTRLLAPRRVVVQSEAAKLESRWTAAGFRGETGDSGLRPLTTTVIPSGRRDGDYTALVQIASPALDAPVAVWDLGASLSRGREALKAISDRIRIRVPGLPVVLQREVTFRPGRYEIAAVAHENLKDEVAADRTSVSWPDLTTRIAALGPIALLQPARAAFSVNGEARTSGFVSRSGDESILADREVAVVGLACRGASYQGPLRLERSLTGDREVRFDPVDLDVGRGDCAQIRDVIPAGALGAGHFLYEARVLSDLGEVARAARAFHAIQREARIRE